MRMIVAIAAAMICGTAAATEPLVAVAANLSRPMGALAGMFSDTHGTRVRLNFGASGDLLRQIQQGAPFEIFIAASAGYTNRAHSSGLTAGETVALGIARMGVLVPRGSRMGDVSDLEELGRMLATGRYRRIAMANPETAPFGVAARQTLQRIGVWTLERDRVVTGENVAQTVQFTLAGGVDAGFIPESYALLPDVAAAGRYIPIPAAWHDPLAQTMVLLHRAGPEARRFFEFLRSPVVQEYLGRHGYSPPPP
jgi:molybdate transport system substrate-binding protein